MDDVLDFFDFSKDFKRVECSLNNLSKDPRFTAIETPESKPKREEIGTEYIHDIVSKEKRRLDGVSNAAPAFSDSRTLSDMDSDDELDAAAESEVRMDEGFYKRYRFNLNRDRTLPIYAARDTIVNAINENPVVIIKGETGCGKTTQGSCHILAEVPQYILDEGYKSGRYCNIVVTQPRRIAAISIANRVSQERRWDSGTVCSYQVGLHHNSKAEDTRLLYCTTGVLLNNLIRVKTLTQYTHIVLDEVHERDQDMDFLLIVVRRLLATNSSHVKIILMSATIDARQLRQYFATDHSAPPVINASIGRKHSIEKFYRDQLLQINWSDNDRDPLNTTIPDETYKAAVKVIVVIDSMERKDSDDYEEAKRTGGVLIFLPGIYEIDTMAHYIHTTFSNDNTMKVTVVRCFSMMTANEQRDIFAPVPPGFRKIILATNIAESSITVPDVSYVIDFCLVKVLMTDSATNFSTLRLTWASKANCRQRAGRVGRLRSGRVYRLVYKSFYQNVMPEFGIPEMMRLPLQTSILRAKRLNMESPVDMLALALDPPNLTDIKNTILLLKEVGALYPTVDGVYNELDGDMTYWGTIMSQLPLDTRLSRLIILGYLFNCLDETISIAAGLSVRGLFTELGSSRRSFNSFCINYIFADGSGCDLIAIWRMYRLFLNVAENTTHNRASEEWAKRLQVSLRALGEMRLLVTELTARCKNLGMVPFTGSEGDPILLDSRRLKSLVLKVVIAGAFYPNYFIVANQNLDNDRGIFEVISGNDPCRTVFFTNFKCGDTGELYTRRIKELFSEVNIPPQKMDVTFQRGSEKVFVTFKEDAFDSSPHAFVVPGLVDARIHKAIKMRLNEPSRAIRVMDRNQVLNYVQANKIGDVIDGVWMPSSKPLNVEMMALPSVYAKNIIGMITHIVHCGKFFFQPSSMADCIHSMSEVFNAPQHLKSVVYNAGVLTKGMMVLGQRKGLYQRAKILRAENQGYTAPRFRVHFVDYGENMVLLLNQLRMMPAELLRQYEDLPPRVFECRLALIQPSMVHNISTKWAASANEMLHDVAKNGPVEMEVYSLHLNVAAVLIHTRDGILNEKLVTEKLVRRADENYMSRHDHDFRLRKQGNARYIPATERQQGNEDYLRSIQMPKDHDLMPPPLEKCTANAYLKGPYSPLEISMYSILRVGINKSSRIDPSSVNGVLLDSDPQDQHSKFIVAHTMIEGNKHELMARGTSQMPNILGFGAFMAMLFSPTMQLKCNKECTKFISILAGLGYDKETLLPYYEEHDMIINLDVDINENDVRLINQMRYNMDTMFFHFDGEEIPLVGANDRRQIYEQLYALLIRLLTKDRRYIEVNSTNSDFTWEQDTHLEPPAEPYGKRSIFPMHVLPELKEENTETRLILQNNCNELYGWRHFDGKMKPLKCKLCNYLINSVSQLRLHLLTKLHRDRESQIGFQK
ncbi:hypothetical protein KR018_007228 [Drosophila ironensis]|nr:hypothetical protein KR018_007228 [Drosophila ironensis]